MKKSILYLAALGALNAAVISDIKFNGLYHLSSEQARKIANLKIGQIADELVLDKALKNLYEYGVFDDIKISQDKSGVVLISLSEKPFVARLEIKGSSSNDKKALEQVIKIRKGQAIDDFVLEKASENINAYYESKGFYDTTVSIEKKPLDGKAIELIFHINRGEPVIIKKVNLVGAKHLRYSKISSLVANREKDFLGWMWGFDDGKLRLAELENDTARIKDAYLKRGYFDAQVSPGYLSTDMKNYSAELSYYIKEGARYKISDISITHPLEENTVKLSVKELESSKNRVVNSEKVRKDIEIIKGRFQDLGYAFAQVEPMVSKDEQNHTVAINYVVNPGEIYKISQVIIEGNDKSQDKVIRRELYLTEGMQFSRTDLEDSITALRKTGYFDDVQIIPEASFEKNALNLHVKVQEHPTGAISGGVGYSTADGFLVNASVSEQNVLGSGLAGKISVEKSKKDLNGSISLRNPRLFDSKYSLGGSVYSNSHEWNTYEEQNRGIELTLGRDFGRHISTGVQYNLEQSDLRKATVNMILSGEKLGKSNKSAVTPYVIYDSTDDYYLPRNGVFARTAFTYSGLGGDQKYQKLSGDFKMYYDLQDALDMDLIFRFRASAAKLFNYSKTRVNNRLYLGGISSVRGYEASSITPKETSYYKQGSSVVGEYLAHIQKISKEDYEKFLKDHANDSALQKLQESVGSYEYDKGGAVSMNSSVELSFPISDKLKLRGSIFYDYGMIGERSLNEIHRSSTGISLDWTTPMGPLNFVFAKPLDNKPGDQTSRFEFSIGSQF